MKKRTLLEKLSYFLYHKLYNRHKYIKWVDSPFGHAIFYPIYSLFNFFYYHSVLRFYNRHINTLSKDTQIFFIGRRDFGTHLYVLHYLRLWQECRGKVSLLVFTKEPDNICKIAKLLLPTTSVIHPNRLIDYLAVILFGHHYVFLYTLLRVYSHLAAQRPDFLHMFDLAESPYAKYNAFLDPNLSNISCAAFSSKFIESYKLVRKQFDYQWNVFSDACLLNYRTHLPKIQMEHILNPLKNNLHIRNPYVVLNVNAKNYLYASGRRTIYYPERYNCMIDALIAKGFDVVLQGRKEQPYFKPRKGLIDYSKSSFYSIEHDLALYAGCEFVISSKSGVEIFATICNVPVLGLNYTEILGMQPAKKIRFYPKFLHDRSTGKIFSWREHLESPNFFEIGTNVYSQGIEYIDMEEEEMMAALHEFLPLLYRDNLNNREFDSANEDQKFAAKLPQSKAPCPGYFGIQSPEEDWTNYTERQKEFKAKLTPLHMELYLSNAVPCDAYLKKCDSVFFK